MPMKSKTPSDSQSDWDSLPETGPPIKDDIDPEYPMENDRENSVSSKKVSKSRSSSAGQSTRTSSRQHSEDAPPYNFKNEVHSPARYEEKSRPGKAKKGQTYEPLSNGYPKKTSKTSFPDAEVMSSTSEEDLENPLYSKIKKSSNPRGLLTPIAHQNSIQNSEKKKLRDLGAPERLSAQKLLHNSHKQNLGIDNEGFDSEEEILFEKSTKKHKTSEVSLNGRLGLLDVGMETSIGDKDVNQNIIQDLNKKMEKCFTWISLPFTCIFLFFHHLLKFFLISLVKPVFIDTLSVVANFFLRPFHINVLNPIFKNVQLATWSISNIFNNILRPLVILFKSCRLVEINNYGKFIPAENHHII